jgi:formylglycine-generating enzyme required for sulfatase activity
MVPIKSGSFQMGASLEEEERQGQAKMSENVRGRSTPVHNVTFTRGFAMGKMPVTVAQFRTFVDETGYRTSDSCYSQHKVDNHFIYESVPGFTWRSPGFPQDDHHPVVCVSGEDAEAYAAWLSKKTGHEYAVPNEAQYEYALRAGTTTSFFWGNDRAQANDIACQYSNQPDLDQGKEMGNVPMGWDYRFQCNDGYAYTSPVGNYKPNQWGLYDMQGNIWEWTSDCWNENYKDAPADGSTRTTGDCDARSSRGGSYGNAAFSAYAGIRAPRHVSYVGHSWGFRVVRND